MKNSSLLRPRLATCFKLVAFLLVGSPFAFGESATWVAQRHPALWAFSGNWDTQIVPNGPSDEAIFPSTRGLQVVLSRHIEVASIRFLPEITIGYDLELFGQRAAMNISGAGVTNGESANPHSHFFVGPTTDSIVGSPDSGGRLRFSNSASAGNLTVYNVTGVLDGSQDSAGKILFQDDSNAGAADFVTFAGGGTIEFHGFAGAGQASFTNNGGLDMESVGGDIEFFGHSSAENAKIANRNGYTLGQLGDHHFGATLQFHDNSSAGNAVIDSYGSGDRFDTGGVITFLDISDAGTAVIDNHGAFAAGGSGSTTIFQDEASAAGGTLIADDKFSSGGTKGGNIVFLDDSRGGTAQLQTHGLGIVDLSGHNAPGVTVGSLDGDGSIFLGSNNLTIGTNDLDTVFSGIIADGGSQGGTGGSIAKLGAGVLVLANANTYTGGTTVNRGHLSVSNTSGSGTGSGPVQVAFGTLGGDGIISGAVAVGTGSASGSALSPGQAGLHTGTLTLLDTLTFHSDAAYSFDVDSANGIADGVKANGVTIDGGASFNPRDMGNGTLPAGTVFTAITNTAASAINGTFSNLPDNSTITVGSNTFQVSYEGGDGNDLTLTVLP